MSWADDIRCLHCDGKLPLYRKITSGQFCSAAHRKAYWQEQERLAVERLQQTHDSLRAYRPPGAIEAVLGPQEPFRLAVSQVHLVQPSPAISEPGAISPIETPIATPAAELNFGMENKRPWWMTLVNTDRIPAPGLMVPPPLPIPHFANNHASVEAIEPFDWTEAPMSLCLEMMSLSQASDSIREMAVAGLVEPLAGGLARKTDPKIWNALLGVEVAPVGATLAPLLPQPQDVPAQSDELKSIVEALEKEIEQQVPCSDTLFALPRIAARDCPSALPQELVPAAIGLRTHLPVIAPPVRLSARLRNSEELFALPQTAPCDFAKAAVEQLSPVDVTLGAHLPAISQSVPFTAEPVSSRTVFALPQIAARNFTPAAAEPLSPVAVALGPQLPVVAQSVPLFAEPPSAEGLFALLQFAACDFTNATQQEVSSAAIALRPQLPAGNQTVTASAQPPIAGLRKLPVDRVPLVHGIWGDSLRALDLGTESGAPGLALMTPVRRPRLRLAAGARYPIQTRTGSTAEPKVAPADFSRTAPQLPLPQPPAAAQENLPEIPVPAQTKLLALTCTAQPSQPPAKVAPSLVIPQPPALEPMRRGSGLEPLDSKPASDFLEPLAGARRLSWMPEIHVEGMNLGQVWTQSVGFWKHAPRDLKMLVFAIPLLLALALHPRLPKVGVKAPATAGGIQRNFERSFNEQLLYVKQSMLDRAAVALDEDFRSGLDDWATRGNLDASWSFDATGFVQPGPLALYRPSLGLADYQMQFLGLIDKQALSWVVRAADFDNYYVVKMVVVKPGPVPTIGITRYAVINGKAQDRIDTVVPIIARNDMLYRVLMDVRGDDFALTVQGQMVDDWSEPRLKHGGIGFFSARGEQSRIRWVQVTHQYDMLGRLCAYLAPYNIPTTNGSW